jgi:hypothetical protein
MTQSIVILYKEFEDPLLVAGLEVLLSDCADAGVLPPLLDNRVYGIFKGFH